MELVLSAALVIAAIGIVWFVSQLGFFWAVFALILSLGALIFVILRQRAVVREEHLYDQTPSVSSIRQTLTPMEYSYRSNLDIPFFSFESQNYGKKTPRKRVRGIPIDRFIEFESKTDNLLEEIQRLRSQLDLVKDHIVSNSQPSDPTTTSSSATASQGLDTPTAEVVLREIKPNFDTTELAAKPTKAKDQLRKFQSEFRLPLIRREKLEIRQPEPMSQSAIYDDIGNVCGSCGGRLKNYQCADRCDPLSQ
jgi:hypothetical protein